MLSTPTLAQTYDTIIAGGTVVDGSGAPGVRADVGIIGDKIAKVGDLASAIAKRRIDAAGRTVIPGFIDLHGHADDAQGHWRGVRTPDPERRAALAHVSQGITTSVPNSDGLAPFMPLREQNAKVEDQGIGLNLAYMISLPRVRFGALGAENTRRRATPDEIKTMHAMIDDDMAAGAWGMAASLESRDGTWTTTEELIDITAALKKYDAVFISHPRSQSIHPWWWAPTKGPEDPRWAPTMFEASEEMIKIAEANDIRVSISHITMRGPDPLNDVKRTVEAGNAARARGVKIYADMFATPSYPLGYFTPLIPEWALRENPAPDTYGVRPTAPLVKVNFQTQLKKVLSEAETDASVKKALETDIAYLIEHAGGAANIHITEYPNKAYIGKSLAELAAMEKTTPVAMIIKMALEGFPDFPGGARSYGIDGPPENQEMFIRTGWVAGSSDGYLTRPGDPGYLDPRFYGAFPAWIRTYVIERKTVPLEFAVRSLTSLAAEVVGIKDRGLIKEGLAADLSVINMETIRPKATIYDIHQYSEGFDYVLVNGVPVVDGGKLTQALPGKILRKPH